MINLKDDEWLYAELLAATSEWMNLYVRKRFNILTAQSKSIRAKRFAEASRPLETQRRRNEGLRWWKYIYSSTVISRRFIANKNPASAKVLQAVDTDDHFRQLYSILNEVLLTAHIHIQQHFPNWCK